MSVRDRVLSAAVVTALVSGVTVAVEQEHADARPPRTIPTAAQDPTDPKPAQAEARRGGRRAGICLMQ